MSNPAEMRRATVSQYLVVAEFQVKQGSFDKFIAEALKVAAASLRDEPGCQRYDVLTLQGGEQRGMVYEVFHDKADHEAHKQTPHFAAFWNSIADLKVRWKVDHGWLHESIAFNTPRLG